MQSPCSCGSLRAPWVAAAREASPVTCCSPPKQASSCANPGHEHPSQRRDRDCRAVTATTGLTCVRSGAVGGVAGIPHFLPGRALGRSSPQQPQMVVGAQRRPPTLLGDQNSSPVLPELDFNPVSRTHHQVYLWATGGDRGAKTLIS